MNVAAQAQPAATKSGSDLQFVAQLLGEACDFGGMAPSASPHTLQHRAAKRRRQVDVIELNAAEPSSHGKALLARYNKPTSKHKSKQYFCEACSCCVSARDSDWATHVSGSKHQRQLVSLLHTGQLGKNVVSMFEAEPGGAITYGTALALQFPIVTVRKCCTVPKVNKYDHEAEQSVATFAHLDKSRLQSAKTQVMKVRHNLQLHVWVLLSHASSQSLVP